MIAGIFHEGSGLGNQLFRYVTTRTLAEDRGCDYGMKGRPFKGDFFAEQPKMVPWKLDSSDWVWSEKKTVENGVDIRGYDPEINFVPDNTTIDGEFQDPRYWEHRMSDIDKWLRVEPLAVKENILSIGFRGGEYRGIPDLYLPKEYWDTALSKFHESMERRVHTDDPGAAQEMGFNPNSIVPNEQISHSKHTNMALNWRAMRYSKYAIIANSSFYILPRLLKHHEDPTAITIAPRYWARRNTRVWALPQNYYRQFLYV